MTPPRPGRWLGPWWSERQTDPDSPDFVPGGARDNVTHRTWTRLGTLASTECAVVDPRGLVAGPSGDWSVDWWIGADDRWHLPSRDVAVRQRLVGHAPVVETAMRVPGGDALHRAFAVATPEGPQVVIEIVNDTPVPFAVAVAIRPYTPAGPGRISTIDLESTTVVVDGEVALLLARPPARFAGASAATGDVVHTVTAGSAAESWAGPVHCGEGRASAALVYPLPHTATLRVALPLSRLASPPRRRRRTDGAGPASATGARVTVPAASVEQVRRGWDRQVARALRVQVPDDRFTEVFEAARRHLLGLHAGEDVASWPVRAASWREIATVATALDRYGFHEEAGQLVATLPDRQALDGFAGSRDEGWSANGAALHAVGEHWRLTRDQLATGELIGPVAKAGHWIGKRWDGGRLRPRRPHGSLPAPTRTDLAWCIRGLWDAADAMAGVDQPEVAEDLCRFAAALAATLERGEPDTGDLHAAALGVLPGGVARIADVASLVRAQREAGRALLDADDRGLDPLVTLELATVELRLGDRRVLDRLAWLLEHASATVTWPSVVHPRTRGGSAGDGHDTMVTAQACSFLRRLLVDEVGTELRLCPIYPGHWLGRGVEVHDAPTAFGRFGFAVRWHGDRPALLWELDPHPGIDPPTLVAPALDPSWSSTELRGEALLAPVEPPGPPEPASASAEPPGTRADASDAAGPSSFS